MKKNLILSGLVVATVAGSWALLGEHGGSHAQDIGTGTALPEVTVARALLRPVSSSADFTGRVQAVDSVELRPRVGGYVESVAFKEGALVHKGDVLFRIDPRPFQAEVDRLTATRTQALAERALAETDAQRASRLLDQRAISQQEADRLATAAQSASAALAAADAALATAKLNLGYTEVRSPIDGRVSNVRITSGNLVGSGDVLTSVVSVNPVYVYFDVDEHTWLKLDHLRANATHDGNSPRIEASMELSDEEGYPHNGRIDFVDNQLHTDSGTMRLRAVFDNKDSLFTPGLYARIRLQSGQPQPRLLIDDRAVGTDLGNQFVYVVDAQHKVQYRKVSTGALFHGLRVIDSGLQPNDVVVVNGLQRVRPGAEVNPQQVAMDYHLDTQDKAVVDAGAHDDSHTAMTAPPRHEPQG
ncbi:efflux RND transporter periplasmic adaptor subunit [Rhodanobacter sp. DHB23]|uniref:efflux RND transporter periplasmic adaptor subunit n=1 Tax=Rhodanobacter sp. DHB23 TaxID=2775923 RepID=UPI00177AB4C9|nr:efflux RND transporter periplasmic adaptor subunit [Rhodanobacter sp. DHB23]MBD8874611.1 efflux RND transporter periplasmic adaptor subunit [Rhodanobacter sp. DHB23]